MSRFTPVEQEAIRSGALVAVAEVCEAERAGLIGMWKEGKAGDKALRDLPGELADIVLGDFFTPEEYEDPEDPSIAALIQAAVAVLNDKAPELVDAYRDGVIAACTAAADAHKGISEREQAMIDTVTAAFN